MPLEINTHDAFWHTINLIFARNTYEISGLNSRLVSNNEKCQYHVNTKPNDKDE
jgi:hypothetical protein